MSTYGTYVSLVPHRTIGKRKTSSKRSKVTYGLLIGKKLGEIFPYFTLGSSLPRVLLYLHQLTFSHDQLKVSHSYSGTIADYGGNNREISSFGCMCRSPSARPTRKCPSHGGNSRWTRPRTVAILSEISI